MVIFISVVLYFLIILLSVLAIIQIRKLSHMIKEHSQKIDKLNRVLYKDLRMVQYKSMDITKQANKYLNCKTSILEEVVSTVALAVLPFKKLKSLIFLHKLGKKIL